MAKDKKASKAATSAPKPVASKPLEAVKDGRVTKPIENAKSVVKDAGKKVAKEVKKASKKVQREPTPESSSDDADDTSDSSASSDDESDQEEQSMAKVTPSGKLQARATGAKDGDSDGDSDSDSSSASDSDNGLAPKQANGPKINGALKGGDDTDDSSSASDSEEEPKINGKKAGATSDSEDDSGDDSSGSSGSSDSGSDSDSDGGVDAKGGAEKLQSAKADPSDSSDASSSDDERDVAPKVKVGETVKKRKAEDAIDQTPKKTKIMVNGEYKDPVANLFVGNLSWNIDEEWLTREFEEFGELTGVRIITDRDSGRSKGYGYVEFSEVDCAVQALEAKNGAELDNRPIRIDFSMPRQPKTDGFTPQQRNVDRAQRYGDVPKAPSKTLFVGNVSFNADESMLTELFQDYGTITAVRLPTDRETQQLKGYGYVDFTSVEEAKAAFAALQGAPVEGRPIRLDYATERTNDSPRGGGGFSRGGGRGGFSDRGGRGGRGGFNDRGRGRGGPRGGRGGTTNRGGFGDFSGKKTSF